MKEFWKGYGLGLLTLVPALVFVSVAGPWAGLLMLVLAACGSLTIAPVTAPRIGGVAAGVLTLFVAGFGLFIYVVASLDL